MGGGGQKSTTNEVKEIKLPAWVEKAGQENYQRAQGIANQPFDPYTGPRVAPLDQYFSEAYNMVPGLSQYAGNYSQASDALGSMLGYNPRDINAGQYNASQIVDADMGRYMSPYTQNVVDTTVAQMEKDAARQQNDLSAAAQNAKAFGGSRQAMQQAIQGAESTQKIGQTTAGLREQAYNKALEAAQYDVTARNAAAAQNALQRQKAEEATVNNQIAAMQAKTGAAKGLTDTATAGQQAQLNQLATYLGLGQMSQEQVQREYDEALRKHDEPRQYELENLNILLATLGLTPYGHTEIGTSTTKSSGGGGGLSQALGIGGQLLGMIGGLSDRESKTDIEKVGEHPTLPLALYAYRYKGDPKSYPKVIGPMAQDVEKVAPHLVKKVGKKRVVDLSVLRI